LYESVSKLYFNPMANQLSVGVVLDYVEDEKVYTLAVRMKP